MRKITLPDWFKSLPMTANLNAMDITHLLGYSQKTAVSQLVQDGSIPRPDWYSKSFMGGKGRPMWRKSSIVREIDFNKKEVA